MDMNNHHCGLSSRRPVLVGPISRFCNALQVVSLVCVVVVCAGCTGKSGYPVVGEFVDVIQTPSPTQAALNAFNVYDPDVRREAVAQLASAPYGGEEAYVKVYRLMLTDSASTVRAAAVKALGQHGSPEDVPRLVKALEDDQAFVRWSAAASLQRLHGDQAVRPLVEAASADEPDTDVRRAAAKALGQYRQPLVYDALVGALNDRDYTVVQAAHGSLVTLTGQDTLPPDSRDWSAWGRDNRGKLFAHSDGYHYNAYREPPGFFRRNVFFWRDYSTPATQSPKGLEVVQREG